MYQKEVKLKREGEIPAWKTGTAHAARLEPEEVRTSHAVSYTHLTLPTKRIV